MSPHGDSESRAALPGGLQVQSWIGIEGLSAQRENWEQVYSVADVDPLGNDFTWVIAHAQAFSKSNHIFGWTIFDSDQRVLAVFPFRLEPKRSLLALPRAVLTHDGTFDSEYLDLLVRPGFEGVCFETLLDLLSGKSDVDCVLLTGFPDSSSALTHLRTLLTKRKLPHRERPLPSCAANLPSAFDDYLNCLKKRMRSKVRSSLRKAESSGAQLIWSEDRATLQAELDVLFDLHGRRWAAAGKSGSFAERERREFYNRLAPAYLDRGQLAFARLERNGETLACQFGAIADKTYYQIQEGYNPAFADERVGIALRAMVIQQLIERGTTSYDFMAGVGRHKTDWGAVSRPCTTIAFALPRWRARLAYGLRAYLDRRGN